MEDFLIQNVMIIDGTNRKPFLGSICISAERITAIYKKPHVDVRAKKIIHGDGLTATPGFVDTHTHSDMLLLHDGSQHSSITQGVTTEIIGQDGLSYAPLSKKNLISYARYLKGINGMFDVPLNFTSVEEYLDCLKDKIAVNVAYLVPHCALRLETVGFEDKLLNGNQMKKAKRLLREGLEQGAKGFSTGLSYFPGAFSDTKEIIELCKIVSEMDCVYVTHLRTVFKDEPFDNVEEALEIARSSGVKLHFSHYRTGNSTIGKSDEIMEKIDAAVNEGVDITLELYPYPYGASYAPMFLPPWANEGGFDKIMNRLEDTKMRKQIARYIDVNFPNFDGIISYAQTNDAYMGKTFAELADNKSISKGELIAELLYSEKLALSFYDIPPKLTKNEKELFRKDVFNLLSRPYYMVGSDAIHVGKYPHPRAYGTFARLLRMARESAFPIETLIQRMTDLPCKRFDLKQRGQLRRGYFADIVLVDLENVTEKATNVEPRSAAQGVEYVFVNGELAIEKSNPTGNFSGKIL